MPARRLDIPPHVAEVIRHLPPDVKGGVKEALKTLATDASCGDPLRGDLEGLWRYRVRRFRIIYEIPSAARTIRVVAVGHRKMIYEAVADAVRRDHDAATGEPTAPRRAKHERRSRHGRDRRRRLRAVHRRSSNSPR